MRYRERAARRAGAWRGKARQGEARHGKAQHGEGVRHYPKPLIKGVRGLPDHRPAFALSFALLIPAVAKAAHVLNLSSSTRYGAPAARVQLR